ncbi:Glycoside hydrolase family 17 protein [Dioscorea alata]|uniref:Glycoside hydrolase family 17 protein n=1 Tax=Dioscorea alata TaxID=55571 RepID=A0ACB7WFU3_DIOAL|nr:Glycoside hydrolase family 17 protein [Dioscorea alata]
MEPVWTYSSLRSFLPFCFLSFILYFDFGGGVMVQAFIGTFGVNYGRVADNIPTPEGAVTLLKAAKIRNVKIYDADHTVLQAFSGSGIDVVVCIPNENLIDFSVNEERPLEWIKVNVQPFLPDTHIRGIAVGNEILGGDPNIAEALVGAFKNVYSSLDRLQLADSIEVLTPHSLAVLGSSYPPSSGAFQESVLPFMLPLLEFSSKIGSHFYINLYPFFAYKDDPDHVDIKYTLFQSNPGVYDAKTDLHYDNMLDAQIDAAYAALESVGYDKMEVRVTETGWPSEGDENEAGANPHNARTYNFNLYKRLLKKKGTPLKPKIPVRVFLFALFNENLKPGPSSERHFGLFKADGSVAYNMGFTGLRSSDGSSSLLSLKGIGSQGWLVPYSFVLSACAATLLMVLTT